jgi:FkbM family methyltransferase
VNILTRIKQKLILSLAEHLMGSKRGAFPRLAVMTGDYVSLKSMLLGRFEDQQLAVLEQSVFPNIRKRICIDIGANIGNHSVAFSKHFEKVYAFEPNPAAFDLLSVNAKWHPNIHPIQLGVSDRKCTVTAVIPVGNEGAARIVESTGAGQAIQFECIRLDEYLDAAEFPDVGFIKIDIEGHELQAIKGCEKLMRASTPMIAFELLREDFSRAEETQLLLKSWGYKYFYEVGSDLRAVNILKPRNYKMLLVSSEPLTVSG